MTAVLVLAALTLLAVCDGVRRRREIDRLRERAVRVAHEVRGPLTAAQLALRGAVRRGDLPPGWGAALELELRRAAGALDQPEAQAQDEVDVAALLRLQEQGWQALAAVHGASVRLLPGPASALARGDALRVAQVTANIVGNAIEHGGGAVEVRARPLGDRIRVEVTDEGPGLPATVADLARRPRGGRGRRGRGLAIASGLVAAYGGRVAALPSASGARVAIDLPAAGAGA
jgi:signal transduction histidine kinase